MEGMQGFADSYLAPMLITLFVAVLAVYLMAPRGRNGS